MLEPVFLEAFNRDAALVVVRGGEAVPIATWYDEEGDEVPAGSDEATQCVAGPMADGGWFVVQLEDFAEPGPLH